MERGESGDWGLACTLVNIGGSHGLNSGEEKVSTILHRGDLGGSDGLNSATSLCTSD